MKIGKVNITKVKKMYNVVVPELIQRNPDRAVEFVAGYLFFKGFPADVPLFLKDITDKFSNPSNCQTVANPEARAYIAGYVAAGGNLGNFSWTYKRPAVEHEPDTVELVQRAHRNPNFIPHYAWPGRDDHKWTNSDRQYNFG